MTGAIAILLVLGAVYSLLLRTHGHPWSERLADTRVRRSTGPNMATLLGVVAISVLVLKATELPFVATHRGIVPLLVGVAVLLVIGYVVVGDATRAVAGVLGLVLLVATEGLASTIALVVVAVTLLWLLGAARGWLG